MKQINYKIKKGHVSYLWRGEGKRWYKARFKKSWFIKIDIRKYTQIYVTKK
jgi:hypothetical protein